MSKFKRVQDAEATPNYLNRFASQSPIQDPYAELEASAANRRAQLNRETGELQREQTITASQNKSWERQTYAENYQQPYFNNVMEADFKGTDILGSSIRRVMSDREVDNGPFANPNEFKFITREEGESMLMHRGASIFNPDFYEIQAMLSECMERDGGNDPHYRSPEERRQAAMDAREESRENLVYGPILRQRETVSARNPLMLNRSAQGVTRVGHETIVASDFGLPNTQSLLAQAEARKERMDMERDRKASIKRSNHKTSQQRHSEWEDHSQNNSRATTFQDQDHNWTDNYLRTLGS